MLPEEVVSATTVEAFKRKLDQNWAIVSLTDLNPTYLHDVDLIRPCLSPKSTKPNSNSNSVRNVIH